MPGVDGIGATRELREGSPETKVLVVSSFSDEERVLPALQAGAVGYLTKDAKPEELAAGIRSVARGEPVLCPEATRHVLDSLRRGGRGPEETVTLGFTDIEDSTPVLEQLGDERARELFREHDRLVREAVAKHGGVEVERAGDAFMLAFSSARRAVLSAVALQRGLASSELPLRVRVGLNSGEVIREEQGYFGRTVFMASRIAAAARGGEILVSEPTRSLVEGAGVAFRDRGLHELKGLKGSHRLYAVEWEEP